MRFTREEFDTMVKELLYQTPVSFDMLCHIAEKTLLPTIKNWCAMDTSLHGRDYDQDIMQNVHIRLIQTTVPNFLLRDGIAGAYNNDPEGFEDWMFAVAKNIKRDFASEVRKVDFKTTSIDEPGVIEAPDNNNMEEDEAQRERLEQAFNRILSADTSVYKVLTWLAQSLFMLEQDVTKIQSNELILVAFSNKTLNEMYDMLLTWSDRIPWLTVSEVQKARIRGALRKKGRNGVPYGETRYSAFFMKYKGEPSGKKSISDWMNRLNDLLRKEKDEEDGTPENTKKTPEDDGDKKGRGGDEASDC